jgi:hypothetical protein
MKVGSKVRIEELGLEGTIESLKPDGTPKTVKITDPSGQIKIIEVMNFTLTLITLAGKIWKAIKSIFS